MVDTASAALYPGTFDPVTRGHLDLIQRGLGIFGSLRVGVARNESKSPLFTADERVEMLCSETADMSGVSVDSFEGLVVDYCKANNISIILRGVRTISDFEYEYQMALTNRALDDGIETVFVMPNEEFSFVSSRLIKEVYAGGGDLERFLTPAVRAQMVKRLRS
ncbi:MAG: pantetheine-phosphate adenylyltransferase [Planctomycetota bacterium]|jgi:pantetheine-phosphate adenylyltransferase|nr:pantetheine-phosphate adenylyltransferase [Planctomycetota bacterium]MDP6942179.1 pantetheine-phosphate adenylyltransferase [Planctomycetota bacterium]